MKMRLITICTYLFPILLVAGYQPYLRGSGVAETEQVKNQAELQKPDTIQDQVNLGRDNSYRQEKARSFLKSAAQEEEKGKLASALKYYFSAIYELEIVGDSVSLAATNEHIAAIFYASELYLKALEYYSVAELIYLKLQLIHAHDGLLFQIGSVNTALGEYRAALNYYIRAAAIQQGKQEDQKYMATTFRMVGCYNALEEYDRSLELNYTILEFYRKQGDWQGEVIALNNLGFTQKNRGFFEEALLYFRQARDLEKSRSGKVNPVSLVNMAIVYQNMGNDSRAIRYLNEAASMVDNLEDEGRAAEYNYLTSLVYYNLKDYHNAIIYNNAAMALCLKSSYPELLEKVYLLASRIYEKLYNYEEAMIHFQQHLLIKDSLQREQLITNNDLNAAAFRVEKITRETESLWASEELSYLELQRLKLDSANRQQELTLLYQSDSIQRITIENQQLENQRTRQALLLREEQVYAAKKEKEVDSLRQLEQIQALKLQTQALKQKEQENEIELQKKEIEVNELNLKKVRTRNRWLIGFGLLAILIIYMVIRGLRYAKRTNKILLKQKNEIERQKDEIDYERRRSDKLLLNILPEETAEELKEKGTATPKHYELVSVLFTDFKGFTNIAEKLTPKELVEELNTCFLAFDKIIDAHGLEKIKTIGDAYMCAGGIPVANITNPVDIVEAGLEIKAYMEALKAEREARGEAFWELRIGIHTGAVVAGVVGKNKFAYDIWGDAVNTASRMESSGIPGKVNISGATYELIKDHYNCTHRGKIQAKNKGEIDMYILEGRK